MLLLAALPLTAPLSPNSNMFYTRFPVPDTTHAPTSRCSGTLLLFLSILPAVPYALALVHSSLAHLSFNRERTAPRTRPDIPYTDIEVSLGVPWVSRKIIDD